MSLRSPHCGHQLAFQYLFVLALQRASALVVPELPRVNAVIYFLVRSMDQDDSILTALMGLHTNFNCKYRYPVVVFTENSCAHKHSLQQWVSTALWNTTCALDSTYNREGNQQRAHYSVTYTDADFSVPHNVSAYAIHNHPVCSSHGFGDPRMSWWQSITSFHSIELAGYDFYWRLMQLGSLMLQC